MPFVAVGLAELGDKTQLAMILLASKTDKRAALIIGAFLGFLLVDGVSVLLGGWIGETVPDGYLKAGSAAVCVLFGILMLKSAGDGGKVKLMGKNPMVSSFLLITFTEFCDKTQIATAVFATRYEPLMVLLGAVSSLTLLAAAAVYLGKAIAEKMPQKTVGKAAGVLFIVLGLAALSI